MNIPSPLPLIGLGLGVLGLLAPALFLEVWRTGILVSFLVLILLRAVLVGIACAKRPERAPDDDSKDWPRYSVLVPLYREEGSVPGLVAALNAIDYPEDQFEVFFLVEEDDRATQNALLAEDLPPDSQILVLPDGEPRTKPRALNVALARLKGEFVTIYDAEDRPHVGQLKHAVAALRAGGQSMACVQAPLRAYNADACWLSGQWALEYDVHFGLIVPALARLGLPIALGGTSNHFRVSCLKDAGGWDAWNVTEDADIGLRFARMGLRVGVVAPPTQEEAPENFSIWVKQRSRWVKGYMQTWVVLMRQPVLAARQMGLMNFLTSFWLLSGAIGSALVHLPCLIWIVSCLIFPSVTLGAFGVEVMVAGYLLSAVASVLAPGRTGGRRLGLIASFWIYWPLLSLAAGRALYELLRTPHSWAKTPHALTQYVPKREQDVFA